MLRPILEFPRFPIDYVHADYLAPDANGNPTRKRDLNDTVAQLREGIYKIDKEAAELFTWNIQCLQFYFLKSFEDRAIRVEEGNRPFLLLPPGTTVRPLPPERIQMKSDRVVRGESTALSAIVPGKAHYLQ
jgi:hypothetical protein